MRAVGRGKIICSADELKNTLTYKNVDYVFKSLDPEFPNQSKGGNSNVFILTEAQEGKEYVIKLSKYDLNDKFTVLKNSDRIQRFEREIEALKISQKNSFQFVVDIAFDGEYKVGKKLFRYVVLEKGDSDLAEYLKNNTLSIQQKFLISTEILNGVKELHSKNIYHRDIKPDNILLVNKAWKITDLGLIIHRNDDFVKKEIGEKIGPANWMTPEAFNKMHNEGEKRSNPYRFDCVLDNYSDVFQLGKLFWFIFQGNMADGQLVREDFKIEDDEIFALIYRMLSHSKNRPEILEIEKEFMKKYKTYQI
jgi:serine/threonine protein kinase